MGMSCFLNCLLYALCNIYWSLFIFSPCLNGHWSVLPLSLARFLRNSTLDLSQTLTLLASGTPPSSFKLCKKERRQTYHTKLALWPTTNQFCWREIQRTDCKDNQTLREHYKSQSWNKSSTSVFHWSVVHPKSKLSLQPIRERKISQTANENLK